MRELPILFSGPLVRAILDGRKTQTRRLLNPQPNAEWERLGVLWYPFGPDHPQSLAYDGDRHFRRGAPKDFARWKEGDRLWVRETWRSVGWRPENGHLIEYAADNAKRWCEAPADALSVDVVDHAHPDRWRPSIFLFRWASRITLEATGVRVERLQEISEEDARAEGVEPHVVGGVEIHSARDAFHILWDRINGKRAGASWEANPWVWCVSFRRVSA